MSVGELHDGWPPRRGPPQTSMTSVQSPPSSITSVLGEDKKGIALVADAGNVADVVANFQAQLLNPADLSVPVAAIQALTEFIGTSQGLVAPGLDDSICSKHHVRVY